MTRSLTVVLAIVGDLIAVLFRSRAAVIAENLFLRRQLALYLERKPRRRRPSPATKFALVMLSRFFPWASALAIVKPDTFVRWHRAGFRADIRPSTVPGASFFSLSRCNWNWRISWPFEVAA